MEIGWLFIGAALGWLIHWLLDRFFWSDKRICTEDEIRLRGEVDGLNTRNAELQGNISAFETERADWNTKFASLDTEMEGYKGQLGTFKTENSDLRSRIGKVEAENKTLLGNVTDLRAGKTDLEAKLAAAVDGNTSLKAKLADFETEKTTLQGRLGDFESKNLALTSAMSGLESDKLGLQGKLGEFDSERASFEGRLADLEGERTTLTGRVGELESANADFSAKLGSLESEKASLEGRIGGLETERTQLQARVGELEGVNADLSTKIGSLESEKASLEGRVSDLSAGNADLETRFAAVESENSSLRGVVSGYESEIDGLKADIDGMKASSTSTSSGGASGQAETSNSGLMAAGLGTAAAGAVGLAAMGGDEPEVETIEVEAPEVETIEVEAVAAAEAPAKDDLKKIYGIGPASERVLNANGIYTFAQLCKSDPAVLETMLTDGNLNASILNEETWPQQACLADDGKWDELAAVEKTQKAASGDDLKVLFGLGPKSERILYDAGIYKYSQLCKASPEQLAEILEAAGVNASIMNEESWPEQACLAADGKKPELKALQKELKKTQADDFSKIYGLGPKSIDVLYNNGVYKYAQLASSDTDDLDAMLRDSDINADLMNEETWPEQAGLLAAGKKDELASLQAELRAKAEAAKAARAQAASGAATAGAAATAGIAADGAGAEDAVAAETATATEAASGSAAEPDDLKMLWGIGPASEAVLNSNGITTYSALANSNPADLKAMLDEADGSFALVREDTWPEQARLVMNGDVDGFAARHEALSAEYVTSTVDPASYEGTKDDLTRLWGIGPAVQKLLFGKGIFTYSQLAGTQLTMLEGVIASAGDRFNLVKPELWIPQAELLAAGDDEGFDAARKRISAENS